VPLGVDPKTIVCEFFKQATCAKGNRCKFSHDLMVGKKAAKINLYEDDREEEKKTGLEIMMMTVYANYLPVYIHSSYVMTMHFIFF
jgi:hypothetical protein